MRRISLVAALTMALSLTVVTAAFAHHVDAVTSTADCTHVTAKFVGFHTSDGAVTWGVKVDGTPVANGSIPAFNGDKGYPITYPKALTGPGSHTVVFQASWPTQGSNNGTFTKTVTGCPVPSKPCPPPTPTPPAPCNCPPGPPGPAGPAGPPGVTTTITITEQHTTVVYVDKTCTSQRVFRLTIAQRLPHDDVYGDDAGQKIVGARITWRGANAAHERVVKHATAKLKLGTKGDTDEHHMRLRVNASFRNVVAPLGQVRVIDERLVLARVLANGHHAVLHVARKVRLCLSRDGDLNGPSDLPQNGKSNGAAADEAQAAAAKAPKYRKAVI